MKKRFILIFSALLAVSGTLSSCARKTPSEKVREALTMPTVVTAECGGAAIKASVNADTYEVTFLAPEGANGVTVKNNGGGATATLNGFARDADIELFPAAEAMVKAIRAANSEQALLSERNGCCEYGIDEIKIMVYYDEKSGLVTEIETEEAGRRFSYRVSSAVRNEGKGSGEGQA